MSAVRRVRWDAAIAVVLPATILLLAGGSSSVARVRELATTGRWIALCVLAAIAVMQVLALGRRPAKIPVAWAVAAVFVFVAVESALWSVDPRLTIARIFTVCVVFVAAAALALGAPQADVAAARALGGVLAGTGAVACASLVVLVLAHGDAVQPATAGAGWRFQGLGENPNTVAMLLCIVLPIATWWALGGSGVERFTGIALILLFVGELAVSGSRGALLAAVGGTLVTALACVRTLGRKVLAAAAIVVVAIGCVEVAKLPKPVPTAQGTSTGASSPPAKRTRGSDAALAFRLEDEIGFPPHGAYRPPVPRTLFGSSGRAQSWNGAFEQGKQRPVAGYGFGTEKNVFVDRYFAFESFFVENAYLGLFLQLGAAGVALFLALLAALFWSGARVLRSPMRSGPAAAANGVLVAAILIGMSQSGLLAVGNIAAASIWICVASLPLLARDAGERA